VRTRTIEANAPAHDPAQQAAQARLPFGNRGHNEAGQHWSQHTGNSRQPYDLRTEIQNPVVREQTWQEHEPGENKGDEEVGDQRMTSKQAYGGGVRLYWCDRQVWTPSHIRLARRWRYAVFNQARNTSATLQACAIQPPGLCGSRASNTSLIVPMPASLKCSGNRARNLRAVARSWE
jgi:hypothetical protein